jgi:hypothetical protein
MSSAFYVAMLLGVTWLMVWAALPPTIRSRYWWPFDFREEAGDEKPPVVNTTPRLGSAPGAARGWRARAGQREASRAAEPGPLPRRPSFSGRRG